MDKILACWNGFLWSLGNTFISTMLVLYILSDLINTSEFRWYCLSTSAVMAAPQIAGILRTLSPKLFSRRIGLAQSAAFYYCLSGVVLFFLPCVLQFKQTVSLWGLIAVLIALWSVHHLSEYVGNVALESWIGGIIPDDSRGRFYARRSRYMLWGAICASATALLLKNVDFSIIGLNRYVFWGWTGAAIIILSNIPLLFCSKGFSDGKREGQYNQNRETSCGAIFKPLLFPAFICFALYGIGFSFCNGLTQSAQFRFTKDFLEIPYEYSVGLVILSRLGQWASSWLVGAWADKALRPTLMVSQGLSAAGLALLAFARPETSWICIFVWLIWSGYSGLNVGVPKYLQCLAQENGARPATFALYYALGGIAYAASLMLSGFVLDLILHNNSAVVRDYYGGFSFFALVLLVGAGLRLCLVPILYKVVIPRVSADSSGKSSEKA